MKLLKLFFVLLIAVSATSCLKNDDKASGTGDVIIVSKKIGENTVYGLSLYAYTFSEFKTVTAVSSTNSGKTYTLAANQGYKTNFYYETADAEMTTTPPAAATFTFSAVFENGDTQTFVDAITSEVLAVPVITATEYKGTDKTTTIKWNDVSSADSYAINIFDSDNKLVFASTELAKTVKSYTVSPSGSGWASTIKPVDGKTYKIRLYAFAYESTANAYNVQATSIGEKTFVWAESVTE
jgi:hypothetical protein